MTAITFPNSPSSGDTHTAGNGIVYTYDGEKWTSIGTNSAGTWTRSGTEVSLTNAGDDLNVDSGTLFVDASTDRVGVGVTSPLRSLHVAASGDVGLMLQTTSATDDKEIWEIQSAANASNHANLIFRQRTNDGTGGIEALRIDSSGRVGIGTTSPSELLEVHGDTPVFKLRDTSAYVAESGPSIKFQGKDSNESIKEFSTIRGISQSADNGQIAFDTRTGGTLYERMRIDSSGRLLVGTSSWSGDEKIVIYNNPTSSGPGYLGLATGTASPANGINLGAIIYAASDGGSIAAIRTKRDGGTWTNGTSTPTRLEFSTTADGASSPTERMRIENDGRTVVSANTTGEYALTAFNDGNNTNRYGIKVQCGQDDSNSTNYAVSFFDGNNTLQGHITFSSGTVTYGAFTAHHLCILPEADNESGYAYGTLVEVTSIQYTQKDGQDTERGILYNVRKTQSANSRAVLGAYGSSMNDGPEGETNLHQALVLGDGHILCNNSGGSIEVGDGICSSATAGIGQKATASPSMIIGIAQENVTFADDTEEKLVAVQYGLQQFIPWS